MRPRACQIGDMRDASGTGMCQASLRHCAILPRMHKRGFKVE
jgi:hypothetical protein